jgi:hypothetical protein
LAILTDEKAITIFSKFAVDMAALSEQYPPGPAKHDDKKFKESYEKDLARCTPLN